MKLPVRTLLAAAALSAFTSCAAAAALELHRGVGVHEWLNWSPVKPDGTYVWPPYRTIDQWLAIYRPITDWPPGDQFTRIRRMGFDFVRLSVDPGPLLATEGAKRQQALEMLKGDVSQFLGAGLKVVFNLQAVSQVRAYSMDMVNGGSGSAGVAKYRKMTVDVARMLTALGTDKVAIEPFNEPSYYPCDTGGHSDWQKVMGDTLKAIRAVASDLTIVASGACGGEVEGLTDLDPTAFDDPDILYSFHMYDPHTFTHQRLDDPKLFGSGLPWPPSAGTPDSVITGLRAHMQAAGLDEAAQEANLSLVHHYIDEYFQENWGEAELDQLFTDAVAWAKSHNIPPTRLFMGEFGAILMSDDGRTGANDADRLRYVTDVRTQAEKYGIPWSIWEYSNPWGMTVILPEGPAVPDAELLGALGLTQ